MSPSFSQRTYVKILDQFKILRVNLRVAMKAFYKVNWDYGLTMSVAILLTKQAKHVNN